MPQTSGPLKTSPVWPDSDSSRDLSSTLWHTCFLPGHPWYCYRLNVCVPPQNLYVKALPPSVMVFGDGTSCQFLLIGEGQEPWSVSLRPFSSVCDSNSD